MNPVTHSNDFECVPYENGTYSIREKSSGQLMHSWIGAEAEALALYAGQAQIEHRVSQASTDSLVIWDVGLGIGANALATIECAKSSPQMNRAIKIFSFENRLGGLELALNEIQNFPLLSRHHSCLTALLTQKVWNDPQNNIEWTLIEGNFLELLHKAAAPDIIYYDFYAPNSCPELWGVHAFRTLFENIKTDTLLYTYAASTFARTAMLLTGFYVGHGVSTDKKTDTTLASKNRKLIESPLKSRWLDRFNRSEKIMPPDAIQYGYVEPEVRRLISEHPQFKSSPS